MSRKKRDITLLWETLRASSDGQRASTSPNGVRPLRMQRLPFDKQCAAVTKSGKRCRGKTRDGSEFCPFHDPAVSQERRQQIASNGGRSRHRMAHLPDGYLRKLTSRRAVGEAMDRLYREVRLGIITSEMGTVLFNVLTRMLDSDLCDSGPTKVASSRRSKAEKIRPKLSELLSRTEQAAWRRAVANARA